jgi:hypothetical protein
MIGVAVLGATDTADEVVGHLRIGIRFGRPGISGLA